MATAIIDILRDAGTAIEDTEVSLLKERFATVESGNAAVDAIFHDMPLAFNTAEGVIEVNGVAIREVEDLFRSGRLIDGLRALSIDVSGISLEAEREFVATLPELPDKVIAEAEAAEARSAITHPDLAIAPTDGSDLLEKLPSEGSRSKLRAFMEKLRQNVPSGATTVKLGLYGTTIALIGEGIASVAESISNATNDRNGCYLVVTLGGETTAHKLTYRYCGNSSGATDAIRDPEIQRLLDYYNINLFLRNAIYIKDTNTLSYIQQLTGQNVTMSNISQLLGNSEFVLKVSQYYWKNNVPPPTNPCYVAGSTSGCISCDPSAPTNSLAFFNIKPFPINYTIKCVQNSTVADLFADAAVHLGENTVGSISNSLKSIFSPLVLTIMGILIAIVIAVNLYLRMSRSTRNNPPAPSIAVNGSDLPTSSNVLV